MSDFIVVNQVQKCPGTTKIFHPTYGHVSYDAFYEKLEENTFVAFIIKHLVCRLDVAQKYVAVLGGFQVTTIRKCMPKVNVETLPQTI